MSQEFESNPSIEAKIKPNHALQEPPLFKVIYINDEVTTMEFLITQILHLISQQIYTKTVRQQLQFYRMRLQNKKVLR